MKNLLLRVMVLMALAAVVCLPGLAMASAVGPFAGTVESFETVASNTPANGTGVVEYGNNFRMGQGVITSFASGVTFTAPVFAGGDWVNNGDPFISDFALDGGITNQWNTGQVIPLVVPDGTAWVGTFDPAETVMRSLEFTLPSPMKMVGAYIDGQTYAGLTMQTYDAANNLLDTQTVASVAVAQWNTNWIGSQVDPGQQLISKVVFSGIDFGVDKLTYSEVPLPPSVLLLGSGLLGLGLLRRRKRRQP
jgi:hypothetical protein